MQKRKMVARARPLMENTPTAIVISTSVQADCFFRGILIDIILDAILADVGREGACVADSARVGPLQRHRKLAHIDGVTRSDSAEHRRANSQSAEIGHPLAVCGGGRVVILGKTGRNETAAGDLVPVVKPDALEALNHDLGRSLVFSSYPHDEQAVVYRVDHA